MADHNHSPSASNAHQHRRQSILATSDARVDSSPIDCVLVYEVDDKNDNHEDRQRRLNAAERREKFQNYLENKQNLILEDYKPKRKSKYRYVKVHTPFNILLLTAESMRMRLPIEKIDEKQEESNVENQSRWIRFTKSIKKPFRLHPSLTKDDPDYYTAVYSREIRQFDELFDTLRGSRELYFTPSERSLLTHELLTRAHCDMVDDDDDDENNSIQRRPVYKMAAMNTTTGMRRGVRRPGIDRLVNKGSYTTYYPLHEPLREDLTDIDDSQLNDREKLKKHWATMRCCLKFQPLSLIRSYMGEKVAFFFALSGFYNQMLIPAAFVGLIIFLYGAGSVASDRPTSDICGDYGQNTYMCPRCDKICPFWKLSDSCAYSKISYVFDNVGTVVFAILMSLWARWFIEFWKRRQAVLQYEWDSIDFEGHLEPIRPEFEARAKRRGEQRVNPVTGITEPYVSTRKRIPYFLIAAAVVLITMAIICATVFATVVYRVQVDYLLRKTSAAPYSSIIITVTSAVMNLICSEILSILYYYLARKLTDFELHKYQSNYDDSLIIKIYLFQFVNFYSSLFYVAFFKGRFNEYPSTYGETGSGDFTEQCDPAGCFVELSIQLIIIMIGKQIINNVLEFFFAMFRTIKKHCCAGGNHKDEQQWEIDKDLYDFNSNILIDEYLELIIQFGFVTLFVVAFPLAPLFALINNLIEIRLDAWKFLSKHKRPIPHKASDIGIWSDIISAVSYIAVLTNAVSIAWTSEFIPKIAFRTLQSTGTSLHGYVNWTLSSFPISDYNQTGMMTYDVPPGLTYCRYRDFRASSAPYSETAIYWNVLAARLAFIIVFEHLIFFIIYLMQWLVPDVPKEVQDKIDHERYIDQRERWASRGNEDKFQGAAIASRAAAKMNQMKKKSAVSPTRSMKESSPQGRESVPGKRSLIKVRISPQD